MAAEKQSYFKIYDSFTDELKLKGLELMVYGVIHSFCTQGHGYFNGSVSYLARRTGASQNGVRKALSSLVSKCFIQKSPPEAYGKTPVYTIPGKVALLHSVEGNAALSMVNGELSGTHIKGIGKYEKDHLDMSRSELLGITDPAQRAKCVREFAYLFSDEDLNDVSPQYVGIVDLMADMIVRSESAYKGEIVSTDALWRAFILNLRKDDLGLSIRDFIDAVVNHIEKLNTEKINDPNQYIKAVIWNMMKKYRLTEL